MQFVKLPCFCFDIISHYLWPVLQYDLYIKRIVIIYESVSVVD